MIVITIISIVGGLMTYNLKGSLAKGRSFKSEAASKEAYDILTLQLSTDSNLTQILDDPHSVLRGSGLVKNANTVMRDGWGNDFQAIQIADSDDFILYSEKWINYLIKEKGMTEETIEDNYPWAYHAATIHSQE